MPGSESEPRGEHHRDNREREGTPRERQRECLDEESLHEPPWRRPEGERDTHLATESFGTKK